jgi:3-deoxy-manno-octulosonate cytidylyltransferase (CMP-KDO synthetase)
VIGDASGVLVVLPARFASTRLPGKPLLRETGKFLVQHAWEQARRLRTATAVVVATDDERIASAVRSFGGDAAMTSPSCATGSDRVAEVARGRSEPLVVNLQADEPEFDVDDVDRLVRAMGEDPSLPLGTLAAVADPEERERPSAVKVVCDRRGRALYFSRAAIPHHRDAAGDDAVPTLRHVGVYVYRRDFLLEFATLPQTPLEKAEKLEQLRALEHGRPIRVVVGRRAPAGIDTRADYEAFVRRTAVSAGKAST